jgi:hypothetical protein
MKQISKKASRQQASQQRASRRLLAIVIGFGLGLAALGGVVYAVNQAALILAPPKLAAPLL